MPQPSCKIERATRAAPTHPIPRAKAGERGATWKRRCDHVILINNFAKSSHETFHLCKLLDSDAGEAAWNYCGAQLHAILEHSPSCHSWEWFLQPQDFHFQLHPPSHDCCADSFRVIFAVADYDSLRKETAAVFDAKVGEVKDLVSKLQKTQKAAEQALDQYEKSCSM